MPGSRRSRPTPTPESWHTIGGQRTSAHFRAAHQRNAALIGIDAIGRVFLVDRAGRYLGDRALAWPSLDPTAIRASPNLLPAAAFVSSFVRSYAKRCWQASHIRHRR